MSFEALKKQVDHREQFLKFVLNFVEDVVLKYGRITRHETGSDHMKVDRELKDFHGFDFVWKLGRSNSIEIYHGDDGAHKSKVLYMTYWHTGIEGCQVSLFKDDSAWQQAFSFVTRHVGDILMEQKARKTHAEKEAEEKIQAQKAADELQKRAERLGLL